MYPAKNDEDIEKRRGYNPEFWNRVQAKRRKEARRAAEQERIRAIREAEEVERRFREQLARHAFEAEEGRRKRIEELALMDMASPKAIVARVARDHGLTYANIMGGSRVRKVVAARWRAIAEVRISRPAWSIAKLGKFFGMDHTSILNALRKIEARQRGMA